MPDILKDAGIFIFPLLACSLVGVFVICERLFSLRRSAILPDELLNEATEGRRGAGEHSSAFGRILRYWHKHEADMGAVRAYARLEVNRMERGLVFLDIVVGAAPLLGLLGTVTGLVTVFGNVSLDTGLPEPALFTKGIAMAMTTTVLGLTVAIPCLIANSYFQRRVETFAVQIESLLEQLGLKDS
ncbi:MotA/TolQ/ExbB proton channel family protein [Pelagicoccus sp. SDUM812005]|uniref:MotA/TolQ/ExbB proton channel family protein n=1 Tax=Pelagicoccus sp. SDUM812005 TaxID=3041257 RepID=UPI00280E5D55|nr:MotA/TolQ/ExbB proton channel family protein [Pelagicoccus sp. SDUM812005]MDQ8180093.1 MotA/TolQ/ExbB proton channel family protein [Pelagicoccus sp. SDUM812005]